MGPSEIFRSLKNNDILELECLLRAFSTKASREAGFVYLECLCAGLVHDAPPSLHLPLCTSLSAPPSLHLPLCLSGVIY
jgi:hypothetical protein